MRPDGVDVARCRAGVAKEPLDDSATSRPLDQRLTQLAARRKRDEQRPLLLLADGKPGFQRRDCTRPVREPRHRHELPRPLVGLALADRKNQKARASEIEVLDLEGGDLGPPPPEANVRSKIARSRMRAASPAALGVR